MNSQNVIFSLRKEYLVIVIFRNDILTSDVGGSILFYNAILIMIITGKTSLAASALARNWTGLTGPLDICILSK